MRVVCNSSVIIALSYIKKLDILWKIFKEIFVPEAVYEEVCLKGKDRVGSKELSKAIKEKLIRVAKPRNRLLVTSLVDPLGHGEAEAIVLALELSSNYICIDDKKARQKAKQLGLSVKGTLGILWLALKHGIINQKEFFESLDLLEEFGFRISRKIVMDLLKK